VPGAVPEEPTRWPAGERLVLGGIRGELELRPCQASDGLAAGVAAAGLDVAFRSGGERVRPGADRHHRTLKYLFQSRGIVPWMRGHVPLIYARGELAAVADLWIADWAAAPAGEAGLRILWTSHAPVC
jgi:tRNA(Ile)-lysidine synthase